ncbi:MAG TPA: hypothetical protein VMU09_06620 [Acidimicrobiales bacterium]|nr:hypothetical protein [Acidimicrobiales bacterium]
MTPIRHFDLRWRRQAAHLGVRLRRAHVAVHSVAATLDKGRPRAAGRRQAVARHHIESVAREIESLRGLRPAEGHEDETAAAGSSLALRSATAAALSLDVMLDAVVALGTAHGRHDTEVLIGACIDAEQGYAESVAVVRAAATAHGAAIRTLTQAFDTDGEVDLRRRLEQKRSAIAGARA